MIIDKIQRHKKTFKVIFMFLLVNFISAIFYNYMVLPLNIVYGGTSGIASITKSLFNWSPSLIILLLNMVALIITGIFLGKKEFMTGLASTFALPVFLWITSFIKFIDISDIDPLIIVVLIGIQNGWQQGVLEKYDIGQGGILQIARVISQKFNISFNQLSFNLNFLVVLGGYFTFGINTFIYAIIIVLIQQAVADKVLLGISKKKAFYIITNEDEKVQKFIREEMKRGASIIDIKGGYHNQKDQIIFTVIPTNEYFILKNGVMEIDPKAFVLVTDSYEVKGGV